MCLELTRDDGVVQQPLDGDSSPSLRKTSRSPKELFFLRTVRCVSASTGAVSSSGSGSKGCPGADSSEDLRGKGVSDSTGSGVESRMRSDAARNWMPRRLERVGVVEAVAEGEKAAMIQELVMTISCVLVRARGVVVNKG